MSQREWSRREFLRFMGLSATAMAMPSLLSAEGFSRPKRFKLCPVTPSLADDLILSKGLRYDVMISWNDIMPGGRRFGFNNDYTAFLASAANPDTGILWVNHEYIDSWFVSGFTGGEKTRDQVHREMEAIGGSVLPLKRSGRSWRLSGQPAYRLDATSIIPIISPRPIVGETEAIGTLGNCAGGVTPWGAILTCEENYRAHYGEVTFEGGQRTLTPGVYGWEKFYPHPSEHYGWVVEVDPQSLAAKKLTALGRFAHECATVRQAADGRCAVYTGDDQEDECLYKFIADEVGSLERGRLYVANLEQGRWIPVDINQHGILKENFVDQTEVMIRCREAAHLIEGTPLDRPEDVEIDPNTGAVIVSLTNNLIKGNYYGSLLRIMETDNDPLALEFEHNTFMAGGIEAGFACPDNLAFDPAGNLWMTSDITTSKIGKGEYERFANNGLFFIPMSGKDAGRVIQVASAPIEAEFTGPCFTPDGKTLFLSVQHPGEGSSEGNLTSHWPNGGDDIPRPSVVTITGPALDAIIEGRFEVVSN